MNPALPTSPRIASARNLADGTLCGIAAVAIWAGWLVMMRFGIAVHLTVPDLTALRFGVAGLVLLPVIMRRGWAFDRLGWTGLAAIVLGGGAPYALVVGTGLLFAPVAHASALTQGVVPLTIALLAAVMLKERLSRIQVVGLVLIVCGGLTIGGIGLTGFGGTQSIGHLCFLGAACLWAFYTVAMRRVGLDGLHAASIAAVGSLVLYLPLYLMIFGGRLLDVPLSDIVVQGLYQGVLTAVVSLVLYGRAVQLLGASSGGALVALGPVMAALISIPILNEWPTQTDWAAITVISVGVYLASVRTHSRWSPGRRFRSTR